MEGRKLQLSQEVKELRESDQVVDFPLAQVRVQDVCYVLVFPASVEVLDALG